MPRLSRSTLLISVAVMIAVVAAACYSPAEKPTAEPPTAVPTVESASNPTNDSAIESTGRTRDGGTRGTASTAGLADPEMQECLATELGIDLSETSDAFDLGALREFDPTETSAAFEACGADFGRPAGGFVGGGIADPEIRDCLTGILGEDALDNLGQGSGLGLEPESLAAFEECGLNFGDGGGGFRLGGRQGRFGGDDGIFGGGGGGLIDGSFQECMAEEMGEDTLSLRINPDGSPPPELQAALEKCGGGIAIPVEPDGGIGDGAGPIPEEPTATPIPVSDLTVEQLTCLSGELDPAALAAAVIATSSGDLSQIPDEVLAALQTCGVGI